MDFRIIRHILTAAITLLLIGSGMGSCKKADAKDAEGSEIVVEVGDTALTLIDVTRRIPRGLSESDSTELFNSIVDSWIDRLLLEQLGNENIDDMADIDRMVETYRRKLIVASYRRNLRASHRWRVPEDSVKRYYREHSEELTLTSPVMKGLYLKLPSDASRLPDIRRWMMTATPDAVDNLEKYGLQDAIKYSFFEDSWTDWSIIAKDIPYRFEDADEFVRTRQNFETSYGGITYLLHISEYMPSGDRMPYEVAAPVIAEILEGDAGEKYEKDLIRSLHARAQKEGRLRDHRNTLKANINKRTDI